MAFLNSLFSRARNKQSDAIARATGSSIGASTGGWGIGQGSIWDIDRAIKDGLEKVVWVFRAVDVISNNQASIPMNVRRGTDPMTSEILKNPRIDKLLNGRPNPYETAWQFRYRLSANLLLSQRGAFVEVLSGADGQPVELHLLPAGSVSPIPDPETFVAGYRVRRGDRGPDDILKPEQVIWFKSKPHPTDPYLQMTPLMSAGVSAETNYLARIFNRNFIANDGRPGLIISVNGMTNPQDALDLKRRFSGGPGRAGETTVIENGQMDIKDTSGSPRDVQWADMLTTTKDDILIAFGVPESVMGNASGRTYDNADAERENFWLDTMVPHCNSISAAFDVLTGNTEDDVTVQFEFASVDVMQRVRRARIAEKAGEFAGGLTTLNDYLEFTGQDPLDSAKARAYIHPQGFFINDKNDDEELDEVRLFTAPKEPDLSALFGGGEEIPEMEEEGKAIFDQRRLELKARKKTRSLEAIAKLETKAAGNDFQSFLDERLNDEGYVESILSEWETTNATLLAASDISVTQVKADDNRFDLERRILDLHGVMRRRLERMVRRELRRSANDIGSTGILDRTRATKYRKGTPLERLYPDVDSAVDNLLTPLLDRLDEAVTAKYTKMLAELSQARQSGVSRTEQLRMIRRGVGLRASWRRQLSISLVTSAIESSKYDAYRKTPGMRKQWISLTDGRTRASHLMANGQIRLVRNKFRVGKSWMRYPGDPTAPLGETINCRCHMIYREKK